MLPKRWRVVTRPRVRGNHAQACPPTRSPRTALVSAPRATLREVIETLAPLERRAGSPGEEQAARWLAERLARPGARSRIEEEQFLDGYARVIGSLAAAGALAGVAALRPRWRKPGGDGGARDGRDRRRHLQRPAPVPARPAPPRPTWNVVAVRRCRAARTLVVLAHHDAAPTGAIFDDRAQARSARCSRA